MTQAENKRVIFSALPSGIPVPGEHLKVEKSTINISGENLGDGDLLLKNLYFSLDPYLRGRMREATVKSYVPAFKLGDPMSNFAIATVLKSNNPEFPEGEIVRGSLPSEEYTHLRMEKIKSSNLEIIKDARKNQAQVPLTYYLGVLGMPGQTAWAGLNKIGKPKKGETLFVSAASGAVGQVVGQLAKSYGLKVIGIAGNDDKVDYLKNKLGFDAAFNYKTTDLNEALTRTCPQGININFENVGGKILDTVLPHMADFGRIPLCGYIAEYNNEENYGVKNLINVLTKRLDLQGFIVFEIMDKDDHRAFFKEVLALVQNGAVKYKDDLVCGIENLPEGFLKLFKGENNGKLVIEISKL